jgi:hypothetical protein
VLRTEKAIQIKIEIMRAFARYRPMIAKTILKLQGYNKPRNLIR